MTPKKECASARGTTDSRLRVQPMEHLLDLGSSSLSLKIPVTMGKIKTQKYKWIDKEKPHKNSRYKTGELPRVGDVVTWRRKKWFVREVVWREGAGRNKNPKISLDGGPKRGVAAGKLRLFIRGEGPFMNLDWQEVNKWFFDEEAKAPKGGKEQDNE